MQSKKKKETTNGFYGDQSKRSVLKIYILQLQNGNGNIPVNNGKTFFYFELKILHPIVYLLYALTLLSKVCLDASIFGPASSLKLKNRNHGKS